MNQSAALQNPSHRPAFSLSHSSHANYSIVSIALIGLLWLGNSWARNLVLIAIAWDVLRMISAASLLFAVGGSRLLGALSWGNLGVELIAAYLLLQEDSLEWFQKRAL